MQNEHEKNIEAFMLDLKALMTKYDASIGGCGCCGSPSVSIGKHINIDNVSADANKANHCTFNQLTMQWEVVTF